MSAFAIQLNAVSKTYRIYDKPFDRIKESILRRPCHRPFEGLKNMSLAILAGETVGVIGENGAGKSTLLSIIAGTLSPSSGEVSTRGRVAALLELGAGFNSEFSGRENIALNASLLGLTAAEIKETESEIIEFAELGQFIDLPLKTYSSGMVIRLGFSIATRVNPDILIIDEALSVGDQYFQEKCIDWLSGFQNEGKIIIFCSHALYLVNKLCSRAIWLGGGKIQMEGPATKVTSAYENYTRQKSAAGAGRPHQTTEAAIASPPVVIRNIVLNSRKGPITLNYGEDLNVLLEYESYHDRPFWIIAGIRRNDDLVCHAVSMARDMTEPLCGRGSGKVLLRYPKLPFLHGEFFVVGMVMDASELMHYGQNESAPFRIEPPLEWRSEVGLIDLAHEWVLI